MSPHKVIDRNEMRSVSGIPITDRSGEQIARLRIVSELMTDGKEDGVMLVPKNPRAKPVKEGTSFLFFLIVSKHKTEEEASKWIARQKDPTRYGQVKVVFGSWVYDHLRSPGQLVNAPPRLSDGKKRRANLTLCNPKKDADKVWWRAAQNIHHGCRLYGSYGSTSDLHPEVKKVVKQSPGSVVAIPRPARCPEAVRRLVVPYGLARGDSLHACTRPLAR